METTANIWLWLFFSGFVVIALAADTLLLGQKHAKGPHVSIKSALTWTFIWIACALVFNGILWVYLYYTATPAIAHQKALEFFTGYLIEKSLSVDNLFAFYMVFHQFKIPHQYQQRVFAYGIWGAIVFRLLIILFGTFLINRFDWILYILGAFLLLTGIKIFFFEKNGQSKDILSGKIFLWLKKHLRLTEELEQHHFFIYRNGMVYITRLFIALIFIEISDIVFAFDSIPAIFAITRDPFIVWTSNIFAILGLRALYFVLSTMADRFYLLKYGVALILMFVGFKMIAEPWLHISTVFSLSVIGTILLLFILFSLCLRTREGK